ncbi:MAG TPA: PilZ domain-containing protein [Bryobacteraceae bacterium]|nr:PilZ domain-containing protein [Bryobacteraceae bacterium]
MPSEDRRREPRVRVDMAATVTILDATKNLITARVADISGSGLLLVTSRPIPVDSPVRIEAQDILLLGEVCRCQDDGGQWRVAVQVRHSLSGLKKLERLNRALMGSNSEVRERAPSEDK